MYAPTKHRFGNWATTLNRGSDETLVQLLGQISILLGVGTSGWILAKVLPTINYESDQQRALIHQILTGMQPEVPIAVMFVLIHMYFPRTAQTQKLRHLIRLTFQTTL